MPLLHRRPAKAAQAALAPLAPTARAIATAVTPDFRVALGAGLLAIAVVGATGALGDVHGPSFHQRAITWSGTGAFLVLAVIATRNVANESHRVLSGRTGESHSAIVKWLITLVGYAIVLLTAFGLLDVPIQHLVLGGALTGIVIGIAAQQSLGNVFAGIVLLLARPFSIGDAIQLKAGALGGELSGVISEMGMVYLVMQTDDGPLSLPNSAVLAAAVGRRPHPAKRAPAPESAPAAAYPDESTIWQT